MKTHWLWPRSSASTILATGEHYLSRTSETFTRSFFVRRAAPMKTRFDSVARLVRRCNFECSHRNVRHDVPRSNSREDWTERPLNTVPRRTVYRTTLWPPYAIDDDRPSIVWIVVSTLALGWCYSRRFLLDGDIPSRFFMTFGHRCCPLGRPCAGFERVRPVVGEKPLKNHDGSSRFAEISIHLLPGTVKRDLRTAFSLAVWSSVDRL